MERQVESTSVFYCEYGGRPARTQTLVPAPHRLILCFLDQRTRCNGNPALLVQNTIRAVGLLIATLVETQLPAPCLNQAFASSMSSMSSDPVGKTTPFSSSVVSLSSQMQTASLQAAVAKLHVNKYSKAKRVAPIAASTPSSKFKTSVLPFQDNMRKAGHCEHGRRRCTCKLCAGSSICRHNKIRIQCKDCGGSQICVHGKRRSTCALCKARKPQPKPVANTSTFTSPITSNEASPVGTPRLPTIASVWHDALSGPCFKTPDCNFVASQTGAKSNLAFLQLLPILPPLTAPLAPIIKEPLTSGVGSLPPHLTTECMEKRLSGTMASAPNLLPWYHFTDQVPQI